MPYGHVLCWRLIEGCSTIETLNRLNSHRPPQCPPIGARAVRATFRKGVRMLELCLQGVDPAVTHSQKYLVTKNRWIDSSLPPIGY